MHGRPKLEKRDPNDADDAGPLGQHHQHHWGVKFGFGVLFMGGLTLPFMFLLVRVQPCHLGFAYEGGVTLPFSFCVWGV